MLFKYQNETLTDSITHLSWGLANGVHREELMKMRAARLVPLNSKGRALDELYGYSEDYPEVSNYVPKRWLATYPEGRIRR